MNLYRVFYRNRSDPVLQKRDRLFNELSGRQSFNENELMDVLANEGIKLAEDFGHVSVPGVTRKAFKAGGLEEKIMMLRRIRGVGFVAATVILSYQNPFKYAKIELHSYNQLVKSFDFPLPEKDPHGEFGVREYQNYLTAIKPLADEYGMKPPDIEYVLYLMDKGKASLE